jgi:phospho-N-acetylmuramoyl-pentapeptide-transferase
VLHNLLTNNLLFRTGLAFLTALVVSLAAGAWLIRFFHRKNVIEDTTQPDHAGLNAIQSQKRNVPTMGGLMILAGIVVAMLLWADLRAAQVWMGMLVLAVLGGAGFLDDYIKLKHRPSRGLTKTQKLAVQFLLGGIISYLLVRMHGREWTEVRIWFGQPCSLGWWYIGWCGLVMAATSNAVNLTDGLDGLAGGLALIAFITLGWVGSQLVDWRLHELPMALICSAAAGAVLGFLWFNCHPAQIFMGDTGSLALGGLLAYAALEWRLEPLLLAFGAVFFIEELTVAMQIVGFKLTRKRIFPITPIHHHFQVNLKWPEQKIVARAWMLGVLFAVLAMILLRVF